VATLQNKLLLTEQPADAQEVSSVEETPAVRHFRLLLRNSTLASNVILCQEEAIATLDSDNYRHLLDLTNVYSMYYFCGKLVLAYRSQDEKLKRALFSTLSAASADMLHAHIGLVSYLDNEYRYESHTLLHDMPIHMPGDRDEFFKYDGKGTDDWYWAAHAVAAAFWDRRDGRCSLKEAMLGP
jgi:hypothetical protein